MNVNNINLKFISITELESIYVSYRHALQEIENLKKSTQQLSAITQKALNNLFNTPFEHDLVDEDKAPADLITLHVNNAVWNQMLAALERSKARTATYNHMQSLTMDHLRDGECPIYMSTPNFEALVDWVLEAEKFDLENF